MTNPRRGITDLCVFTQLFHRLPRLRIAHWPPLSPELWQRAAVAMGGIGSSLGSPGLVASWGPVIGNEDSCYRSA